jgi:hypothetical protein
MRPVRVFRLGGPDAGDAYSFAETPRLAIDPAGFIFAALASEATIAVYDPSGRLVRRIGRRGEGPGEFQVVQAHGFIGDTLWVRNWPSPRISLFRKDGTHLSTVGTPFDLGHRTAAPGSISGYLGGGRSFVLPYGQVVTGNTGRVRMPVLLGRRDMTDRDTVAEIVTPSGLSIPGVGAWSFAPIPVSPRVSVSSAGTAIAIASWDTLRPAAADIRVLSPSGAEQFHRRVDLGAQPIPRRVRDSLLAEGLTKAQPQLAAARRRGMTLPASNERLVSDGLALPSHYPPVKNLIIGSDGTIWIERFGAGQSGSWLVLDNAGAPLFRVDFPGGFELQQASRRSAWGTDRDELDVSYLVRFDLVAR